MEILNEIGTWAGLTRLEELVPIFLWGIFLVLVIMAVVLSYVLYYHFTTFGFKDLVVKKMGLLYFVVCIVLALTASILINAYLNSL